MTPERIFHLVFLLLITLSLASCDTIAQGYVNRLPHSITIVEHPGPSFTLAPGQINHPGFGQNPRSFDILRDGRIVATYRMRDLAVPSHEAFRYVVIDRHGVHIEREANIRSDLTHVR